MKNTEKKLYGRKASHVMKTDIRELDNGYEVVVDLPGFTKDEVQATLENGYLTVEAEKGLDKEEKEQLSRLLDKLLADWRSKKEMYGGRDRDNRGRDSRERGRRERRSVERHHRQ